MSNEHGVALPITALEIVDIARKTFVEFEGREMQFEGILPWVHAACERVARAAIAQHRAQVWQPIETAPKDERAHILLSDGEFVAQGFWQEAEEDGVDSMGADGGFVDMHYNYFSPSRSFGAEKYRSAGKQPTHWMPLPATPHTKDATA